MNDMLSFLPLGFVPAFLKGMVVNFEIAWLTLMFGLLIGGLLTAVSLMGGVVAKAVSFLIALIRAMPTFLMMISLLYLLPRQIEIGELSQLVVGHFPGTSVSRSKSLTDIDDYYPKEQDFNDLAKELGVELSTIKEQVARTVNGHIRQAMN